MSRRLDGSGAVAFPIGLLLLRHPGKANHGESLLMEITSDPLIDLWVFVS